MSIFKHSKQIQFSCTDILVLAVLHMSTIHCYNITANKDGNQLQFLGDLHKFTRGCEICITEMIKQG